MIMRTELIKDAELVKSYIEGNENSLAILINRHKQKIYSFIYSKVFDRDITEDVFQDTFIKVIRTLKNGKYNEEGKFLPWVMRIAHNLVIDHFRKSNRIPKFDNSGEFNIFSVISDSSLNAEKKIIKNQVEEDLRRLEERENTDQDKITPADRKIWRTKIHKLWKDELYELIENMDYGENCEILEEDIENLIDVRTPS